MTSKLLHKCDLSSYLLYYTFKVSNEMLKVEIEMPAAFQSSVGTNCHGYINPVFIISCTKFLCIRKVEGYYFIIYMPDLKETTA